MVRAQSALVSPAKGSDIDEATSGFRTDRFPDGTSSSGLELIENVVPVPQLDDSPT